MYKLNHVMTVKPSTRQGQFAEATQQLSLTQLLANAVIDEETGRSLEYRHLIKDSKYQKVWVTLCANEFGRLAQGVGKRMPNGTSTIKFITKNQVPDNKKPTYARFVCDVRPQKAEKHRTRITVGCNLIEYPGEVHTPTTDMDVAKLLFNSVISTPRARFFTLDIKDFYLNTPMEQYEYIKILFHLVPNEIKEQYDLNKLVHNDFIFVEVRKGMYGLPQAGRITHDQLKLYLSKFGHAPVPHTPGLWKHCTRDITFCLLVDNFGIKYTNRDDVHHLITALKELHKISIDWRGELFCGIILNWNYQSQWVDLSMPGYIPAALHKFQHPPPKLPTFSPHLYTPPVYTKKPQLTPPEDTSPYLDDHGIKRIQR
eukprot:692015-Ditylum_brightwellii.AAC.1